METSAIFSIEFVAALFTLVYLAKLVFSTGSFGLTDLVGISSAASRRTKLSLLNQDIRPRPIVGAGMMGGASA